jgi:uncharacterized protein YndB with AHSA1/START domain
MSGYTITRVFAAPRNLVWEAFTQPEHFAVWWGGRTAKVEDARMDVRVGGTWSARMLLPEGNIDWDGEYLEVVPPERLVMTLTDRAKESDARDKFTITLADLGDKTELVLTQDGGNLTDEQYAHAKEGTSAFLDTMAELLAELQ